MGVSSDNGANADLAAAMSGGSTFEQRLAELATAKQSLADAYTNLGLGNSAKLALEEAEKAKAEAASILDNAKANAKAIVIKAQEDAERMTSAARKIANDETNVAREQIAAQKAEAAELRSKAKADAEAAASALKDAQAANDVATKLSAEAEARKKKADDAVDAYNAERAKLKALRAKAEAILKATEEVANV